MKNIICNCEDLLKPIKTVSGIVERNTNVPVLGNILFEQNGREVVFVTTDQDIQIRTHAAVGVEGESSTYTVNAQKISDILGTMANNQSLEIDFEDPMLRVSTSNGVFQLQTLPATDFPKIPEEQWQVHFTVGAKTLRHILTMTAFAMAGKDVRYYLNGVLLIVDLQAVRCVATDTHRLAYCEAQLNDETADLGADGRLEMILPRKTVRELLRILPEDDSPVSVKGADLQVLFSFGDVEFMSKLIEGKFPDYERVLPTPDTNPCPVNINRESLATALRRVHIMMTEKFHGVRWMLSRGLLQIQGNNNEQEEATQDIPIDWKWDNLDLGFNILYLLDVLSVLKTTDVCFHFAPTSKSVLLTMPDTMSFRYVVMPMRI